MPDPGFTFFPQRWLFLVFHIPHTHLSSATGLSENLNLIFRVLRERPLSFVEQDKTGPKA